MKCEQPPVSYSRTRTPSPFEMKPVPFATVKTPWSVKIGLSSILLKVEEEYCRRSSRKPSELRQARPREYKHPFASVRPSLSRAWSVESAIAIVNTPRKLPSLSDIDATRVYFLPYCFYKRRELFAIARPETRTFGTCRDVNNGPVFPVAGSFGTPTRLLGNFDYFESTLSRRRGRTSRYRALHPRSGFHRLKNSSPMRCDALRYPVCE